MFNPPGSGVLLRPNKKQKTVATETVLNDFTRLPDELLIVILLYLPWKTLNRCFGVNKNLSRLKPQALNLVSTVFLALNGNQQATAVSKLPPSIVSVMLYMDANTIHSRDDARDAFLALCALNNLRTLQFSLGGKLPHLFLGYVPISDDAQFCVTLMRISEPKKLQRLRCPEKILCRLSTVNAIVARFPNLTELVISIDPKDDLSAILSALGTLSQLCTLRIDGNRNWRNRFKLVGGEVFFDSVVLGGRLDAFPKLTYFSIVDLCVFNSSAIAINQLAQETPREEICCQSEIVRRILTP